MKPQQFEAKDTCSIVISTVGSGVKKSTAHTAIPIV